MHLKKYQFAGLDAETVPESLPAKLSRAEGEALRDYATQIRTSETITDRPALYVQILGHAVSRILDTMTPEERASALNALRPEFNDIHRKYYEEGRAAANKDSSVAFARFGRRVAELAASGGHTVNEGYATKIDVIREALELFGYVDGILNAAFPYRDMSRIRIVEGDFTQQPRNNTKLPGDIGGYEKLFRPTDADSLIKHSFLRLRRGADAAFDRSTTKKTHSYKNSR
jgi:hypothetical protein